MSNFYDRILKENIETIIPFFIREILKIDSTFSEIIKDKLQYTLEKEVDYILIVHTEEKKFILHLEFQTGADKNMARRMLLYRSILSHLHKLPVFQYVIYLGDDRKPNIPVELSENHLEFSCHLINIRDLPAEIFLKADTPEGVILSILADRGNVRQDDFINNILVRLQELIPETIRLEKYTFQLRILSQLRKLQNQIIQKINKMALKIDIRKDPLYREGKEEGSLTKSRELVINLIRGTDFTDDRIALLSDVTTDFVKNIRLEITPD